MARKPISDEQTASFASMMMGLDVDDPKERARAIAKLTINLVVLFYECDTKTRERLALALDLNNPKAAQKLVDMRKNQPPVKAKKSK